MTDSDPLDEAIRAYRASVHGRVPNPEVTRRRIMQGLPARQSPPFRNLVFAGLVVLALGFTAPTAWAFVSERLPDLLYRVGLMTAPPKPKATSRKARSNTPGGLTPGSAQVTPSLEPSKSESAIRPKGRTSRVDATRPKTRPARKTGRAHSGGPHRPRMPPVPPETETPPVTPERVSPRSEASEGSQAQTPPVPSVDSRADAAERARFEEAHRAHFARDPGSRVLAAWDAYLDRYPRGRYEPEARYNRALTLIRLGRTQEARAALEPFAFGAYEGFRRQEAQALIEALSSELR